VPLEQYAVALEADDVFQPDVLQDIERLSHALATLEGVTEVWSLATAETVELEGLTLALRSVYETPPDGADEIETLRRRVHEDRLLRELVAEDDRSALILLEVPHYADIEDKVSVELKIDGQGYTSDWFLVSEEEAWGYLWKTEGLTDGLYVISARSFDGLDHSVSKSVGVILRNNPVSPILDSDGDGIPNYLDAFPDNPYEWEDRDGDGYGDNSEDKFPLDRTEWAESAIAGGPSHTRGPRIALRGRCSHTQCNDRHSSGERVGSPPHQALRHS